MQINILQCAQVRVLAPNGIHARGSCRRLYDRKSPDTPDLVFPQQRAVLLVCGCSVRGPNCNPFQWPTSSPGNRNLQSGTNLGCADGQLDRSAAVWWRVLVSLGRDFKARTKRPSCTVLNPQRAMAAVRRPWLQMIAGYPKCRLT